jgi:hypothetical protein
MPHVNDQPTEEDPESPEVVAHDGQEEQPLWCVGQSSCGSNS